MGGSTSERADFGRVTATAKFVHTQRPFRDRLRIGQASLHEAIANVGYRSDDRAPDYVVLGETQDYSFDEMTTAVRPH